MYNEQKEQQQAPYEHIAVGLHLSWVQSETCLNKSFHGECIQRERFSLLTSQVETIASQMISKRIAYHTYFETPTVNQKDLIAKHVGSLSSTMHHCRNILILRSVFMHLHMQYGNAIIFANKIHILRCFCNNVK